ncbi:MAG: ATP-binding protein [Anaerosomatales bacterium]|nr:ATP-binding protein [Anaerosomatales bacterium]
MSEASGTPDPQPLERLLAESERWLMRRVLHYAKEQGYARYTSTLEEPWRVSIAGLTASLVQLIDERGIEIGMACEEDVCADPASRFGIAEARSHRARGVGLGMFLGLIKYYRTAYEDLVWERVDDRATAWSYCGAIARFFDRVEIAFVSEWAGLGESDAVAELQERNRHMTNEKNKYLTIFESLSEPAVLFGPDCLLENVNETAARLFSLGEEISGSAYYSGSVAGNIFEPLAADVAAFTEGRLREQTVERTLDTVSGPRHFIVRLKRMLDVSGKFHGTIAVLSDVTERKQAEETALRLSARYRSIFSSMLDAVAHHEVIRDATGAIVDYRFLDVNDAFEELTGMAASEVVGRTATEVFPTMAEEDAEWIASFARVVDEDTAVWFEREFGPLGRTYSVRAYRSGPERFGVVFTDVTGVREATRQLQDEVAEHAEQLERLVAELEQANRVKDAFMASMSHELRTPLNSVLGFSGILLDELAGPLNDEQRRQLGMIRSAGQRLLGLVNDLLDLSRIESGRVDVAVTEFDLVHVAEEVVESMRPLADAKGLQMAVIGRETLVPMWNDEEKIAQVLINLVSNAIKFTNDGAVDVEPTVSRDGLWAMVRVTDTGRGIASSEMDSVFQRFSRAKLDRPAEDGAGLGLAISKRLAELCGGTLLVESALGRGSTFTLKVPVRHREARL